MAPLSDDTKWWIQISAVYVTLGIVAFRIWEKRNGRAQDGVSVNFKRWTSQRMANVLNNGYSEWDMIKLEENAQNMRTAYELLKKPGKHPCPWGRNCPAKNLDSGADLVPGDQSDEKHIRYAYNMTKLEIDRNMEKRKGLVAANEAALAGETKVAEDPNRNQKTLAEARDELAVLHHPSDETRLIIF
jgi:hypothetical protein